VQLVSWAAEIRALRREPEALNGMGLRNCNLPSLALSVNGDDDVSPALHPNLQAEFSGFCLGWA